MRRAGLLYKTRMASSRSGNFRLLALVPTALLALTSAFSFAGMTPAEVKRFDEVKLKAQNGDSAMQVLLGGCYSEGRGVEVDRVEAIRWFRRSAEQGNHIARNIMGSLYMTGNGVERDWAKAVYWYRLSAEQGDADSQSELGARYELGQGVLKDEVEAYAYYKLGGITAGRPPTVRLTILKKKMAPEAISRGERRARELQREIQAKIAAKSGGNQATLIKESEPPVALERPAQAVAVSRGSSFEEIKAAAEQGDMMAQFIMGDYYSIPVGKVVRDDHEGFRWYLKAARQGMLQAQIKVRTQYSTGMGTKKDYVEAYAWAIVATAGGDEASVKASRDIYLYNLSDAEQRLASRRTEQLSNEIAAEWDARKRRTGK